LITKTKTCGSLDSCTWTGKSFKKGGRCAAATDNGAADDAEADHAVDVDDATDPPVFVAPTLAEATQCTDLAKKKQCKAADGCAWKGGNGSKTCVRAKASTEAACSDIKKKKKCGGSCEWSGKSWKKGGRCAEVV